MPRRNWIARTAGSLILMAAALAAPSPAVAQPAAGAERALHALVTDVYNEHRVDQVVSYFAPDYVEHDTRIAPGLTGLRSFLNDMFTGFPDLTATPLVSQVDNDRAMVFVSWHGHQTGPFAGRPASGRELNLVTSELFRFRGQQVAEHWDTVDYSVLKPFGVTPQLETQPRNPELTGYHTDAEKANAARIIEAVDVVMTQHRLDLADRYYEQDYQHHNFQRPAVDGGLEAFRQFFASNFITFPDLSVRVDHVLAHGDRVAISATWSGHFTGDFHGVPPTGQMLVMHTSDQYRFGADGKVAEHWEVVDYSSFAAAGIPL
ncbi:ester cyclase [Micromonospora mangrovi]|uniref:Ester cyclase family protein n=2 Tax=Micromonospora TaxID=1873 RepID=A0AAU7M5E3_9ACTN